MTDEFMRFYEAAKALITYIDKEDVFDRAADMGCGGFDTSQSDTFYNLILNAKAALKEIDTAMAKAQ